MKNHKTKGLEEIKIADEAPRAPEEAKMSPKESPEGVHRRLATREPTIQGATLPLGGPQGRPRARGVYLINQVINN